MADNAVEQCKGAGPSNHEPPPEVPVPASTDPSNLEPPLDAEPPVEQKRSDAATERRPLVPLAEISWPPEPDESVFMDPLRKEDPKPLRREELLRIGASGQAITPR